MLIEHPHSHEVMDGAARITQSSLVAFFHTHDVGRVFIDIAGAGAALKFKNDYFFFKEPRKNAGLIYLLSAMEGVFSRGL